MRWLTWLTTLLQVRLAAINSGANGGWARDVLIYCYESSDPTMREAAANALEEIATGSSGSLGRPMATID